MQCKYIRVEPHLDKFAAKRDKALKIQALGGLQSRGQKMPLPELKSRRNAARVAIERRQDKEAKLGVKITRDKKSLNETLYKDKRISKTIAKKKQQPLHMEEKFDGVMKLNKKLIKKYKSDS